MAFTYSGLSRRVAIASTPAGGGSTVTTSYLWCGSAICQARNASNATTREYLSEGEYVPGTTPATYYYGPDQIGSVRRAFASTSSAPAFSYDPYGVPLQTTTPLTDFNYAGMFFNADSGLDLTQYRAYDPVAGRWLSRDPLGEASNPVGNLYPYVNGNPISLTDPAGLSIPPILLDVPVPSRGSVGVTIPCAAPQTNAARPLQLAETTTNPDYAAKMLGYDRLTFGQMIHEFKPAVGLNPGDNVTFHSNGDVFFGGELMGNIHDYAP